MVVSVGGSPQVPVTQAISAGNDIELLLEFAPTSYIVADDDLSVDSESVTVSIVEGSTNLIKLSVASGASVGESFEVKFRQQVIVNGSVTSAKVWPKMTIDAGTANSEDCTVYGFELPEFDASARLVVKCTSVDYDVDLEFGQEDEVTLTCDSDDLPDDFLGYIALNRKDSSTVYLSADGQATKTYEFTVLSLDQNGQQIYP